VADWQEAVAIHLTTYSAEAYESGLRNVLADQARLVRGLSPTVVDALAGARGEVR
jgi:hypothetical protein